jgi:hypothetical protein
VVRSQRTSVRYITRFRSNDARSTIETVGGAGARWHLRRRRLDGSDLVGTFPSPRGAAEADAAKGRCGRGRRRDEGEGRVNTPGSFILKECHDRRGREYPTFDAARRAVRATIPAGARWEIRRLRADGLATSLVASGRRA